MKKIKVFALSFLLAFGILMMTGCGRSDNNNMGNTTSQTTQAGNTGPTRPGEGDSTENTGVSDGMVNDVEQGVDNAVDDVMGDRQMNGQDKSAQETTTGAQ